MIPLTNHDSRVRENSEVVMKFTQMFDYQKVTTQVASSMIYFLYSHCQKSVDVPIVVPSLYNYPIILII